jgi:hypothetical protein
MFFLGRVSPYSYILATILKTSLETCYLRTPVATPPQPPRTRNVPDQRCAVIRTSRVYPQVISSGIYSLTQREKTQNPGSNILNLGSRKFWKFPKTRSSI